MEEVLKLEKSIYEHAPQVPFVQDQIGAAISWAKEVLTEGEYIKALTIAYEVAKYTAKTSEGNFYKTHLVITAILAQIPNALKDEKFKNFDTASKAVENTLKVITVDEKVVEEKGKFKALSMHIVPLANKDQDCLAIMLLQIKYLLEEIVSGIKSVNVKTPITSEDYTLVLGIAKIMTDIYLSKVPVCNEAHEIFNKINIMLNEDLNY